MPRVGSSSSKTSGSVRSQRPMMTFCWLPPESARILVSCEGVFVCIASIDHLVSAFMDFELSTKPKRLCLLRLEMTVFSRMFRIEKIPVARRSSVRSAKRFLIDWRGFLFLHSLPPSKIVPVLRVATPKIVSSVSVRPLPSRPASPRISPRRAVKDTSCSWLYMPERFLTSR